MLTICAVAVCLLHKNLKQATAFMGILALCMLSFLPYVGAYSSGSSWSSVVEFPVTSRLLWRQFNFALGNPNPGLAWFWHVAIVVLIVASAWRLFAVRSNESDPDRNIALFGSLVVIGAVIGYYEFLQLLSYLTRSWYYLALLSLLAVVFDRVAASLAKLTWVRVGRLLFALTALVVLPFNAWPKVIQRQTNIDIVSRKVAALATPADLIVLTPWQYGITFNRYYRGTTPWMTLPVIDDHRVHRYDLFQAKMNSTYPIADVLEAIRRTLVSGHRVWFVGGIRLPAEGRQPRSLPPTSNGSFGLDNVACSEAWQEQLGAFVRTHTERGETVPLVDIGPVNEFENVPLIMVEGWHN